MRVQRVRLTRVVGGERQHVWAKVTYHVNYDAFTFTRDQLKESHHEARGIPDHLYAFRDRRGHTKGRDLR